VILQQLCARKRCKTKIARDFAAISFGTTKKSRVRTPPNNDGNIPFHSLFQN
jgi:hypothetical protein